MHNPEPLALSERHTRMDCSGRPAVAVLLLIACAFTSAHAETDALLSVHTAPEGAEVWLGDTYIGDSPIVERRMAPGRYTVRIVSPLEHVSETEEVFLQAGQHTAVEKTIRRKYGSLRLTTRPAGAQVGIGTSLGETPLANDHMTPGRYRLSITHPRRAYVPLTQDVTLTEADTVRLDLQLERRTPFTTKALVRIALGAGAVAGFTWALVEQGIYQRELDRSKSGADPDAKDASESAGVQRTLGLILGGACVLGFEVVAFF